MANQAAKLAPAETVPYVNTTAAAIDLNSIIFVGGLLGLLTACGQGSSGPNTQLAINATGRAVIDGAIEAPKLAGTAVKAGQSAYWDSANSRFTPVPTENGGHAYAEDAASAATRCKVKINCGVPGGSQVVFAPPTDASANGDNAFVTFPFAVRLIDWWIRSKDTGAANVKLRYLTTDITAVVAKGTANDALVRGSTIVEAQKTIPAGTVILINLSAAQAVEVNAIFVRA